MTLRHALTLTPVALLCACTTAVTASSTPMMIAPDLQVGAMAHRTAFEQAEPRSAAERPVEGTEAEAEDLEPGDVLEGETPTPATAGPPHGNQRARSAVFGIGIALTVLGTGGVIGMGALGYGVQRRINEGYEDGMTREREARLKDAGTALNKAAIGSAGIGLVGLAMAAIAFGLDYTACGKLARRRADRDCPRRR